MALCRWPVRLQPEDRNEQPLGYGNLGDRGVLQGHRARVDAVRAATLIASLLRLANQNEAPACRGLVRFVIPKLPSRRTAYGFSTGSRTAFPHSVHDPS